MPGRAAREAIRSALREIRVPLVGSTITPIVVFLPLISITGVTGTFFRALAVTVGVALLTSLALALTWTPALSHLLVRSNAQGARTMHSRARRRPDSWAELTGSTSALITVGAGASFVAWQARAVC